MSQLEKENMKYYGYCFLHSIMISLNDSFISKIAPAHHWTLISYLDLTMSSWLLRKCSPSVMQYKADTY